MDEIVALARREGFSGVVHARRGDEVLVREAFGLADRAHEIPNEVANRFGIASGAKGFTALTVMSLVEDGGLTLATTAREVLDDDLPLIDGRVTVEHLLAHRSGIGDYFDEEAHDDIADYAMPVPVHRLAGTEDYLPILDGYPQVFEPGSRFAYNNGGYVVLAVIAQRVAGQRFEDLVVERVCAPAGLASTSYLRYDQLPGNTAIGYVDDGLRANTLHLPVLGSGDGGMFSTAADIDRFWSALHAGRIVSPGAVAEMTRPRSDVPQESMRYGMGFWLHATGPAVSLEGYDAGVSFRTVHEPTTDTTHTVLSNTSEGAWPITKALDRALLS